MLLWKRLRHEVWNKDGLLERHFVELRLSFKSKNQLDWILLYEEEKVEISIYARAIWFIK